MSEPEKTYCNDCGCHDHLSNEDCDCACHWEWQCDGVDDAEAGAAIYDMPARGLLDDTFMCADDFDTEECFYD